jgi:hypothetical protein
MKQAVLRTGNQKPGEIITAGFLFFFNQQLAVL